MTTATEVTAPKRILKAPFRIYDISTKGYIDAELYVRSPKSETGTWYELMLKAQNSGYRLATSSEWFHARQYLQKNNPEEEQDFINGPLEWTGTVLDFEREELLEGITLNSDSSIKNVKTRLGKKEGIVLPDKSTYVNDLGDDYMPLVSQLWGVQDPKRELPDYAYLWIQPGFRPVVRGLWNHPRDGRRVSAVAGYEASHGGFASRFVSDTMPEGIITMGAYKTLVEGAAAKRAELEKQIKALDNEFGTKVVFVE